MRKGFRSATMLEGAEAIEARLEDLERRMERLRGLYESFFMGVERMPPNVPRRELNRLMVETQQIPLGKASIRFRFQSLMQKWVQYTTYWNRTLREIEAGTYRRDIAKVEKRLAERGTQLSESEAIAMGIPAARVKALIDSQKAMHVRREARRTGEHPAAPPAAPPTGYTESTWRAFYDRYVDAHKAVGQAPRHDFATMSERLGGEISRMIAERKLARVDMDVEVVDGKVKLRAKPVP